jgi:hypothetical protein
MLTFVAAPRTTRPIAPVGLAKPAPSARTSFWTVLLRALSASAA